MSDVWQLKHFLLNLGLTFTLNSEEDSLSQGKRRKSGPFSLWRDSGKKERKKSSTFQAKLGKGADRLGD